MQHETHPNHHKKRKSLPIIFLMALVAILGVTYFSTQSFGVNDDIKNVATSTPKVSKPKTFEELYISISPRKIEQGEPALITVEGLTSAVNIKSFTFDSRPLVTFIYNGQVTALLGVDLNSVSGTFPLILTFFDGKEVRGEIVIGQRTLVKLPFDIPEKLGGNTPLSIKELFSTLAKEGKIINALPTNYKKLWTENFRSPLDGVIVVQDPYGYTRIIGNSTMPHKGVDIQAPIGTPIYAMNIGEVKFTGDLRNYGNTVVIDHGLGLQTVYMHLSEISVTSGQMVQKGELIAKSGDTGYVLGPHLHLTVRIWDISIDPIKFLEILGD